MTKDKATASSWTNKPLGGNNRFCDCSIGFNTKEFDMIAKGLVPRTMDNEWFIYYDLGTLFFHLSGSGTCIYKVLFKEQEGRYTVSNIFANNDKKINPFYGEEYEISRVTYLIRSHLLGKELEEPKLVGFGEKKEGTSDSVPSLRCVKCRKKHPVNAVICPHCGKAVNDGGGAIGCLMQSIVGGLIFLALVIGYLVLITPKW